MSIKIKKLELQPDSNGTKRSFFSRNLKRTLISIVIGAIAGFGIYYFTEGQHMETMITGEIIKSIAIGGFFGFFVTNSPCARNRC